jgi:hypothetical protein
MTLPSISEWYRASLSLATQRDLRSQAQAEIGRQELVPSCGAQTACTP